MKSILLIFAMICSIGTVSFAQKAPVPKIIVEKAPDSNPTFEGGEQAASAWIKANMPDSKDINKEAEAVYLFFNLVINEDGKVIRAPIVNAPTIDVAWKKKVSAIVRDMPNWKPGLKDGKPVVAVATVSVQLFD